MLALRSEDTEVRKVVNVSQVTRSLLVAYFAKFKLAEISQMCRHLTEVKGFAEKDE